MLKPVKLLVLQVFRHIKNLFVQDKETFRKIPFGLCKGFCFPINFRHETRLYLGLYERELYPFFKAYTVPGMVCYDIGAAKGYFSLALAGLVGSNGKVYAVEADEALFQTLQATIQNNQGHPHVPPIYPLQGYIGLQAVPEKKTVSLDHLVFEQGLPIPDLIKMDIEGAEWDALNGARQIFATASPKVILEVHSLALENRCRQFLEDLGYRVTTVGQSSFFPEYRLVEHNGWLCAEK